MTQPSKESDVRDAEKWRPGEVFHPAEYIFEEARARGWSIWDVAERMGGDPPFNVLQLQFYSIQEPDMHLGDGKDMERAFGVSAEFWLGLEWYWRDHPEARSKLYANEPEYFEWYGIEPDVAA